MDTELMDGDATKEGHGRITYRDVSDAMARVERELRDGQARIEGKLDAYILSHSSVHNSEQVTFNQHLVNSAVMGEKGQRIDETIRIVRKDVDDLKDWRAEVKGMTNLVKFAVGTSLIGAIVSGLTLINILRLG